MSYVFVNGKKIQELNVTAYTGPQDTTENVTIGTAGTLVILLVLIHVMVIFLILES